MSIILIMLLGTAVLCFLGGAIGVIANRPARSIAAAPQPKAITSRSERKEIKELRSEKKEYEQLVHRIDKIVYDNRQLDPALATMVIDEIAHFKANRD